MFRTCGVMLLVMYIYVFYCDASKGGRKQDYEVVLENVQECKAPSPPYVKTFTILPKYEISVVNGKRYLSGNTTVTAPTPFQNGSFAYENLDLNKVMHAIPAWHAPGDLLHELQLVIGGATEFCTEIKLQIIQNSN